MDDSDVATFVYIVNGINNLLSDNNIQIDCQDGTIVITGAEGASCHIYDLQGIEITSKTNLEKQAMIKVKSPNVYLVSVSLNNGQTIMQKL